MDLGQVSGTRCVLVWVTATAAALGLGAGVRPVLAADVDVTRFDAVLVRGCATVAAAVTAWLWLVVTAVVLDAVRGRARERRAVPDGVRRGVLLLCGAALTAGLAAPAGATGGSPAGPAVLAGLRLPERIAVEHRPPGPPHPAPVIATTRGPDLLVHPGDSLWSLTADRLGPRATTAQISAQWPRLYAANRDLVGPDPDRIEPGQRLVWPDEGAHDDRH